MVDQEHFRNYSIIVNHIRQEEFFNKFYVIF